MTSPKPIAFEPAGKSAPPRRETGPAGEAHSFADTMQAQRATDRSGGGAAQGAAGPAQTPRDQANTAQTASDKTPAQNDGTRQPGTAAGSQADKTVAALAKTDASAAQGRAGDQAAAKAADTAAKLAATSTEKSGQAAAKTAAADGRAAHAQTVAAAKTAQASAQQAGPQQTPPQRPGAAATLARGDGQTVQAVVQSAQNSQARPVSAATAVAAHTAATATKEGGQAAPKTKTAEAVTAKTVAAEAKAVDDPTAKALRDALTGGRETAASQRGDERPDPHAARTETRPTGQRATGGMSPALRAAAEAVQQQLTGGSNPTTAAGTAGAGTPAAGQPPARADAGALPTQGQTFDPVLQNTGPQPGGAGQPGSLAAAGKAAPTAGTGAGNPAPTAPPAEQVAVQIQRAAAQGQSKVQIRLNPAELGRVDVKLDVGDDGHVRAVLSVDKPETLDLMQRDPRALERALQAAGLKTDSGSLSFNLREDGTGHGQNAGGDGRDRPGDLAGGMPGQPTGDVPIAAEPLSASLPADGRVDIRV